MYGLGHFVFDFRTELTAEVRQLTSRGNLPEQSYEVGPREGWPLLPLHEDTRMTVFAWAKASKERVHEIGFIPCRMTPDGLVHPLESGSPESDEVISYMERANTTQALGSRIVADPARSFGGLASLRVIPSEWSGQCSPNHP